MDKNMLQESLIRAHDNIGFAADQLRDALRYASALESLLILPVIEKTVTAQRDINAMIKAMNSK